MVVDCLTVIISMGDIVFQTKPDLLPDFVMVLYKPWEDEILGENKNGQYLAGPLLPERQDSRGQVAHL